MQLLGCLWKRRSHKTSVDCLHVCVAAQPCVLFCSVLFCSVLFCSHTACSVLLSQSERPSSTYTHGDRK
jgi:hypothetical protein